MDSAKPRRSAGMRGSPANPAPEHQPVSTAFKTHPEKAAPVRVSPSPYAKPKVLMGEVTAPRGAEIGKQRDAFRAFMLARGLRPTTWAQSAGVPANAILAFLTGKARTLPPDVAGKLATAAGCAPGEMFR